MLPTVLLYFTPQGVERTHLSIKATHHELELIRRLATLIGTRAARLSSCGVAAIATKKKYQTCHVGADGSVFNKYPHFKERGAVALREILDWPAKSKPGDEDPIEILAAEDGSGVGAALIAALTLKRAQEGNLWSHRGWTSLESDSARLPHLPRLYAD